MSEKKHRDEEKYGPTKWYILATVIGTIVCIGFFVGTNSLSVAKIGVDGYIEQYYLNPFLYGFLTACGLMVIIMLTAVWRYCARWHPRFPHMSLLQKLLVVNTRIDR